MLIHISHNSLCRMQKKQGSIALNDAKCRSQFTSLVARMNINKIPIEDMSRLIQCKITDSLHICVTHCPSQQVLKLALETLDRCLWLSYGFTCHFDVHTQKGERLRSSRRLQNVVLVLVADFLGKEFDNSP